MIAERIKLLREKNKMTQSMLAKKLNVTRSSVNAWEMGVSVPSTALIIELARYFKVSTDYLLGLQDTATLDISSLNEREIAILYELIQYFNSTRNKTSH